MHVLPELRPEHMAWPVEVGKVREVEDRDRTAVDLVEWLQHVVGLRVQHQAGGGSTMPQTQLAALVADHLFDQRDGGAVRTPQVDPIEQFRSLPGQHGGPHDLNGSAPTCGVTESFDSRLSNSRSAMMSPRSRVDATHARPGSPLRTSRRRLDRTR